MDNLTIRFNKGLPLYEQLYIYLCNEIKSGHIISNEKMPSKRALAQNLNVSINTVDTAYQMLVAEGYVNAKERSGFYACRMPQSFGSAAKQAAEPSKKTEKAWLYNFETSSIDTSLFPFKLWCRIQREVMGRPELLNHGDKQGDYNLRCAVCDYLREYRGVACSPHQLVIGAGIEYFLSVLARMFASRTIALEDPGYERAARALRAYGAKTIYVPVDEFGMKAELLSRSGAKAAYITPSHQFPTGVTMPIARRHELLSWAYKGEGRYLIEDDYNSEFRFSSRPVPSMQGLDGEGRVVYIGTFSKSVAPSIRVAYMVLPQSLLELYKQDFGFLSSTVSRFEQQALYSFIENGHFSRHLNRLRIACRARRDALINELSKAFMDKVKIHAEHTGLHLLAEINCGKSENELKQLAENVGVRLTGLSEYYHLQANRKNATLVMGYAALNEDDIKNAIILLKNAWLD